MKKLYNLSRTTAPMFIRAFSFFVFFVLFRFSGIAQTSIPAGNVSGTWTLAGSPYNVNGHITVPTGSTLTIQPGVSIIFQGHYKFNVQGRVLAIGTVSDTIIFTAANTTTGWWGMRFDNTPSTQDSSIFKYCKLQWGNANGTGTDAFGGAFFINGFSKIRIANSRISNNTASANSSYGGGIYCSSSSPIITGNTINNNVAGGIYCSSSSAKITYNTIRYNTKSVSGQGGGAIWCTSGSSATITNNTISNNISQQGGGIWCASSSPSISSNNITNNTSSSSGGGIGAQSSSSLNIFNNIINNNTANSAGGGVYVSISSSPTINNNTITNNTASGMSGGGIYCDGGAPVITNNTISNNIASGTSQSYYGGGGIFCISNSPTITNNTINNNTAAISGGGVSCYSSSPNITANIISNNTASGASGGGGGIFCISNSSPIMTNNIIINNTASGTSSFGGGIYCTGSSPKITNTTIANNNATGASGGGGGLYCTSTSNPVLKNTILWGNAATSGFGANVYLNDNASDPPFDYCDVQGGTAAFETNGNPYTGAYTNNINTDPLFVSPSGGAGTGFNGLTANWALQITSPCINTGDPNGTLGFYPATDLAGNPRVVVCTIDMGAYEYQSGLPFLVSLSQQNILCNGSGSGTATATVSNGSTPYTYLWSNGQSTSTATGLSIGNYTITVNDASSCIRTGTVSITQPAILTASMTFTTTACNVNDGIAKVTAGGGVAPYTFLWSNGQTTSVAVALGNGSYTATVTDANGCTKTVTVTVTLNPSPTISSSTTQTACNANTGTATATPSGGTSPYTFLWSGGQSTSTATGFGAGNYTVTVTDFYGCANTGTVNVTFNTAMSSSFIKTNVNCFGGNNGSATVNISNGVLPYIYVWSNGQTTQTATGLTAATYTVTATDSLGCSISLAITITQPAVLAAGISAVNASCGLNDGSATANTSGGTSPYTYIWTTGQTTQTSTGMGDDIYSVLVTDANGCTIYEVATVGTNPPGSISICVVTVDSASSKNVLVWDKPQNAPIDSFKIYRQISSIYTHIGSVPYSALSTFTDITNGVNPNTTSYRYKISVVDTCANESQLSVLHRTIHLAVSPSSPCGYNLFWNDYIGFPVMQYRILRDTTGTYNWQVLDSVSLGINVWTDNSCTLPLNTAYLVEVIVPGGGCEPQLIGNWERNDLPAVPTATISTTKSNTFKTTGPVSVNENLAENMVSVYPNPTMGKFTIQVSNMLPITIGMATGNIEITNLYGEKIFSVSQLLNNSIIDISDKPNGIYFLKVISDRGTVVKKIVINH